MILLRNNKQQPGLFFGLALLLLAALPLQAADSITNYFFRTINAPSLIQQNDAFIAALDSERYEDAMILSHGLVDMAERDQTIDKMSYARALSNAAVLDAVSGDRDSAILRTGLAIKLIEASDPFHPDLLNILMVKSYTHNADDMHLNAEDDLRRAQHIAHRMEGVYSKRQIPIIESIAGIKLARGEFRNADQEQRFNLKVSEQAYGIASEELIPTLERLGAYFADRGGSIPLNTTQDDRLYRDRLFRESTKMLERSITIIEGEYGPNDLRLLSPLKGLSRTKYLQGYGRINAERPMERALEIVKNNPATDTIDQARAIVDLADLYTVTSDVRASALYLEAWQLLAEEEAHLELRYELFGRPHRLRPEAPITPVLFRHPVEVEEGIELYVDIQYDIREDGKVRNARVLDGNVPNADRKMMRDFVTTMRFRPRIMDGALQITEDMSLHQTYRVRKKEAENSFSISSGIGGPD
ncbi:MAG: hypothetical protein ACI82A_000018 [Candidatus Azotimanducaceae bacterium]|jgi:hypothetical protein